MHDNLHDKIYAPQKTADDVNAIIIANKNLVYYVLHKTGHAYDATYESAAYEGLWSAVETFNVYGETAFVTYAYTCILNAVYNEGRKQKRIKQNEQQLDEDFTYLSPGDYYRSDAAIQLEAVQAAEKLRGYIQRYIQQMKKSTIAYSAVQLWYASGCELSTTELAERLSVATPTISKALATCRAYISTQIYLDKKEGH